MRRILGIIVWLAVFVPQPACNLVQVGGSTNSTNDDSSDNANENADDGAGDNTIDNGGDDIGENGDDSSAKLAVFRDPDTDFSTTDVHDVDEEIVRFDTSTNSIIWAADGTSYMAGVWTVNDVFLAGGAFQVRFGTKSGERRAYFTEVDPPTICQIEPRNGSLSISRTPVLVPQE